MIIEPVSVGEYSAHYINSIKQHFDSKRSLSKAPTFALQYNGTWVTLMKNCGFTESEAKQIENNYRATYVISEQHMKTIIQKASKQGYLTVAFGLRVRTPLLNQVILGNNKTPYEAEAEGRTVGNAAFQSYGLLNSYAANQFMSLVRKSKYRLQIKINALIHDAIYLTTVDDLEVITWVNKTLVKCMEDNPLNELKDPIVKLGAELDLFYPHWGAPITLPNNSTTVEIARICKEENKKRRTM